MVAVLLLISITLYYLYLQKYKKQYKKQYKSILITGASKGIGKALAIEFAKKKYKKKLFLLARDKNALNDVIHECNKYKDTEIFIHQIDVTNREKMEDLIKSIYDLHFPDLIIANAGVTLYTGKKEKIDDAIYNLYNVNLFGVLNTILPAISCIKSQKKNNSTIAIMSSQAANIALPGANAFYSSSKAAISYLRGLRKVLDIYNINLVIIQPGYIQTAITEKSEDLFIMKYINGDLTKSCQKMIKKLEEGERNINFPIIDHYLISFLNILPYYIQDKLWVFAPNLIMGEKLE